MLSSSGWDLASGIKLVANLVGDMGLGLTGRLDLALSQGSCCIAA
jgi:hypothetical protein